MDDTTTNKVNLTLDILKEFMQFYKSYRPWEESDINYSYVESDGESILEITQAPGKKVVLEFENLVSLGDIIHHSHASAFLFRSNSVVLEEGESTKTTIKGRFSIQVDETPPKKKTLFEKGLIRCLCGTRTKTEDVICRGCKRDYKEIMRIHHDPGPNDPGYERPAFGWSNGY